ncbi:MAG: DegT/DnrJ/EryC1/StrS family aminotransferase [Bacteroidia bacterium]|nr:DegT/DnrJ/EryC1/StrS family aminotransferase [Bacteroidia bacterium]
MVDVLGQYRKIQEEVDREVLKVITSGQFINGPWVQSFKANLAEYLGVKYVIPCGNGTDALQVALMALDLKPGDEVITAAFTFVATAEVIALLGLKPVFVDIDPATYTLDPAKIEAAITPRTRCIIPVHLYGLTADMEAINNIAKKHNLFVVEDAAQSIGSDYTFSDGRKGKSGTLGDIGTTSFYPSKNLGAYGDGGAIFTNDDVLGAKLLEICNHGSKVRYYHSSIGVNSRLDSMQAAVLDIKLRHLNEYNKVRNAAAAGYNARFAGVKGLITPHIPANATHVFHQYTVRILEGRAKRDAMQKALQERGIPSMIYYPVPLHLQEAYLSDACKEGDLPLTEELTGQVISLPMHSELDEAQIDYIANHFLECYNQ